MVFKSPIDGVTRARVFHLCQLKGFSVRKVAEICNISRGSVCRVAKEKLLRRSVPKTIFKRGPKFKLSERQQRLLIRAIKVLRSREGNFTCKRLMQEAGIKQEQVSERTLCRYLNTHGYCYLQSKKKGLITEKDMQNKVKFAKNIRREYMQR